MLDRIKRFFTPRRAAAGAGPAHERLDWESKWARQVRSGRKMPWAPAALPPSLRQAIDEGWLPAGARILDVGCGLGEIAGWLADNGFDVVGVDIAPSAIAHAQQTEGDRAGRLSFAVADITVPGAELGQFDAALDRGCLHGIRGPHKRVYAENLARALKPGGRFLLLHKVGHRDGTAPAERQAQAVQRLEQLFAGRFDIESMTPIEIARDRAGGGRAAMPALAARLIRRRES